MSRPLLPIFWGFISGIVLEHILKNSSAWISSYSLPDLLLVYGALGGLCYGAYLFKYHHITTLLLLLLAVLTGMSRYAVSTHLSVDHISHFIENERVTIEGFLYKPPQEIGTKRYLDVETAWLEKENLRYRTHGKIRIILTGKSFSNSGTKQFAYGDTVRVRLRLHIPWNFTDFDYREYLRRQGIYLVGTLRHDRYVVQLPEQQGSRILRWIYHVQHSIQHALDTYVTTRNTETPEELTSLTRAIHVIQAMTLGTSYVLESEVKEMFRYAGMYHFLVVSGIHIGILSWVLHKILQVCMVPLRYRSIVLGLVLLFYAGLTGFHFPVLRAVIMAITFFFSITFNRISEPLYNLLFSAGVILFLFPTSLFQVSFQLTVAATVFILLFFRFLKYQTWFERINAYPRIVRVPLMSVMTTFSALLGVSPLMLYHFGEIYPSSFISNLLAFPIVSLLLPISLLSDFLSLIVQAREVLSPLLFFNVLLAKGLIMLSSIFPDVNIPVSQPSLGGLIIYYVSLYIILTFYRHRIIAWNVVRECLRRLRCSIS